MSAEQIVATFEDLFSDYEKLKNGKQILEDFLVKVPQFATTTCRIITSTEVNAEFRKNVCYVMKNVLKDNWMENKVLIKERKDIKEILLNGLVLNINDFKIIEVLSLTIAELIKQEGPAGWEAYLKEVIEWMNTEDESIINTGLDALSFIFAHSDSRLHIIVPGLMPILFQIFTNPDLTEKMREKLLILLYLAIDSFSFADGNDKKIIHACFDQTYQEWMSIFVSALQTTTRSHLNIKRYILKILTRIFSDLVHYTAKSLAVIIQPVWKFLNTNLPLFIWSTVYGVPVEQIEDGMKEAPKEIIKKKVESTGGQGYEFLEDQDMLDYVDGLTIQLIELMITLTERRQLEPILRLGIFPLTNSLAYYMLFSKEQERNWFDDPNQFVADDEDEGNMISVRNGALKIIDNLIESYGDEATQALMVISEKFLTNMKEEEVYGFLKGVFEKVNLKGSKASVLQDFDSDKLIALVKSSHFEGDHPDHVWKKREVGLLLLGKYSEDIVTFMSNKSGGSGYDLSKFLEQLIKGLDENTNPIIKGRTLWCVSQYSEVISSPDILLPLFKISSLYIEKENPLPVRLMAVKSMRSFASKIEKLFLETLDSSARSEYRLNSVENLKNLFDLLSACNEETIHIILEALFILARMNPDFVGGLAVELSQKMVEMYQMLHRDALNGGILKDLVKLFCSQKDSYLAVSKAFLPYITEILEYKVTTKSDLTTHLNLNGSTEEDFLGALFDIVRLFVKCEIADKDFESLLKLFPIILNFTQASSEISLLNHATICIKAYVMHYSEYLKKLNLSDEIFKCIFKLLHVDTNESALIYVGNLIILVFANILGSQVNVDILKQVILKLSKCRLPSIIQSLVLIYARLINIDTKETISFLNSFNLDGKVALKALIDKWFVQQPLFRGRNTRTSTFLALTKLFLAKDDRVDNLLVIGYNPSHTNIQEVYAPFKIFSLLIRALDFEIKSQARKAQEAGRPGKVGEDFYGEDGRLDTVEDDEDFGYKDDDDDYEDVDKLQVDLDIHDDMGYMDHKFKAQEPKGKGLADIETGSACYMSEMMDFDFEAEEADEIAEEDLIYLKDVSCDLDLVGVLKEFFSTVAKEDPEYFSFCVKHLLQDDIKLLQSHIQFRNN